MSKEPSQTVLVVDDTPENIDVLKGVLGKHYLVKAATNGPLALKIAASANPPDLIMLDVMMPGMDGYEVCSLLKADERTRPIPVIFATAKAELEDEAKGFALGAADYITKPVRAPLVLARVRTHLAMYDRRRHLEMLVAEQTQHLESRARELHESRLEIIRRLGRAAEYRDNETGMHIVRISHLSSLLARKAGLGEVEVDLIMHASMMHDVGKIGISDLILLKPGKLTPEEFEEIKKHPEIGAEIIGEHQHELLALSRSIALTHHEKWNGQGYPHGLAGEDIPLAGRITAIVDIFDALTSDRPYKKAWSVDDALALISQEAGHGLDPRLVELFLELRPEVETIVELFGDPPPTAGKEPQIE